MTWWGSGYPPPIVPVGHVAPVPRRVRAVLGDVVVLDTTRALYVWEWPPYSLPTRELLPIAWLIAFYDEKVDVIVDGEPRPRPTTPFSA